MMLKLKRALVRKKLVCSSFLTIAFLFCNSCATYSGITKKVQGSLEARDYSEAQEQLEKVCKKEEKNQLLCLVDMGMISYLSADYENAVKHWLKADDLASQLDVVSVSEQGMSLLLDDNRVAYRGEHHEKILISVYLALSFLKQKKYESALVESRKIAHKHKLLEQENEKTYKQNAFAKYLSGKMFEAEGEYNEAFLYYREANILEPGIGLIQDDLLRMAERLNFSQEYNDFKKAFGKQVLANTGNQGELVLILENGLSPRKISKSSSIFVAGKFINVVSPEFVTRSNRIGYAVIKVKKENEKDFLTAYTSRTYLLNNIDQAAKNQLSDSVKIRLAKTAGSIAVKQAAALGIGKATKNEFLGALVGIGLNAMQTADTRSWLSLPANLQIGSVWLPQGVYEIELDFYSTANKFMFSVNKFPKVTINTDDKQFITWRTFE